MSHKTAIIHYLPLEFYPPVTNFINCISKDKKSKVYVYSSVNNNGREVYENSEINYIYRSPSPKATEHAILRLFKYFVFNFVVFFKLYSTRPDTILYYETYSVLPVYWYLKFVNKKTKLFIHYHEYFSKEWYTKGMKTLKYYHKLEQAFMYKRSTYITQTNQDRVELFLKDNPKVEKTKMRILPNYPPKRWCQYLKQQHNLNPIKSVYVGSLSLETMYVKEYCTWVQSQEGKVIFSIYGYNVEKKTHTYLSSLNSDFIQYHPGGIEYSQIPNLLSKYNVGVILYKALIDNFKYNAPNKLFEYISGDLEIWYSNKILGIKPYEKHTFPRILSVDFECIVDKELLGREGLKEIEHAVFIAEDVYMPYIKKLIL